MESPYRGVCLARALYRLAARGSLKEKRWFEMQKKAVRPKPRAMFRPCYGNKNVRSEEDWAGIRTHAALKGLGFAPK